MAHIRMIGQTGGAIVVAFAMAACRTAGPPPSIDPRMASCVPPGTLAIAGANLAQLRASAVWEPMAPEAGARLETLRDADYLLVTYNGTDILAIARGVFQTPMAGAVMVAKDIALSGSPETVRTAAAQHKIGRPGAPWLLDRAAHAASATVWAAAQGGVKLPGNSANWNKLLGFTEYATLAAQFGSDVRVELRAGGRAETGARQFEETLRALFSLAAAASARDQALAGTLRSIQVRREGDTVQATVAVPAAQVARLLAALSN